MRSNHLRRARTGTILLQKLTLLQRTVLHQANGTQRVFRITRSLIGDPKTTKTEYIPTGLRKSQLKGGIRFALHRNHDHYQPETEPNRRPEFLPNHQETDAEENRI